jgi:hypothetical protein
MTHGRPPPPPLYGVRVSHPPPLPPPCHPPRAARRTPARSARRMRSTRNQSMIAGLVHVTKLNLTSPVTNRNLDTPREWLNPGRTYGRSHRLMTASVDGSDTPGRSGSDSPTVQIHVLPLRPGSPLTPGGCQIGFVGTTPAVWSSTAVFTLLCSARKNNERKSANPLPWITARALPAR